MLGAEGGGPGRAGPGPGPGLGPGLGPGPGPSLGPGPGLGPGLGRPPLWGEPRSPRTPGRAHSGPFCPESGNSDPGFGFLLIF